MAAATEQAIRDYWQAETCGTNHTDAERLSKRYFDEIEAVRYRLEPYIFGFAQFDGRTRRRVLEIGVGAGTDFINFARNGARLTGVDLTQAAIDHARRRLELEGLEAELQVASAERLPFDDQSFDLVYSWGVLHHAETPEKTFAEVRRVLAPGGEARIMLYGRHSWVAYKRWLFGLLVALKRRERPKSLSGAIEHYMESPGTRCYTPAEIVRDFRDAGFTNVEVEGFLTPYDQRFIGPLARRVRRDWNLGVTAS
jgi:ubiquinone/menaquinone biosynthesis C-methylase UbiE